MECGNGGKDEEGTMREGDNHGDRGRYLNGEIVNVEMWMEEGEMGNIGDVDWGWREGGVSTPSLGVSPPSLG